jgi:hypothetical protein
MIELIATKRMRRQTEYCSAIGVGEFCMAMPIRMNEDCRRLTGATAHIYKESSHERKLPLITHPKGKRVALMQSACFPTAISVAHLYRETRSIARMSHHFCQDRRRRQRNSIGPAIFEETMMGKYFIAWLLGVPFFVLVLIYFIF